MNANEGIIHISGAKRSKNVKRKNAPDERRFEGRKSFGVLHRSSEMRANSQSRDSIASLIGRSRSWRAGGENRNFSSSMACVHHCIASENNFRAKTKGGGVEARGGENCNPTRGLLTFSNGISFRRYSDVLTILPTLSVLRPKGEENQADVCMSHIAHGYA